MNVLRFYHRAWRPRLDGVGRRGGFLPRRFDEMRASLVGAFNRVFAFQFGLDQKRVAAERTFFQNRFEPTGEIAGGITRTAIEKPVTLAPPPHLAITPLACRVHAKIPFAAA